MALNYLLDPMFQIENSAGKPATDGWLEVYIHGTRTKYYCASNFDGTLHPFKIKLDSLGSNIVLADDGQAYDVYAYNRFGSLLMSRYKCTARFWWQRFNHHWRNAALARYVRPDLHPFPR